jgi:hypothetical protein
MLNVADVRPFLPIDVPMLARLASTGVSLDTAHKLTRDLNVIESAMLYAVPLADLGMPTFVIRKDDSGYVAQFRHKHGEQHAHIAFIAPGLDEHHGADEWLHLISAMTASAARRGALTLNAEIEEDSPAMHVLHRAGFSTYARQEIWRRAPAPLTGDTGLWRPAQEQDSLNITALYASIVPRLVMQADYPPDPRHGGLVFEKQQRILGYLAVQEGKHGLFIQPYLHPEIGTSQVDALICSAIANLPKADRLPVYISVRRYQSWLKNALEAQGFEVGTCEALMVKHTTARVERPAFRTAYSLEGAVATAQPVGPIVKRMESYRESSELDGTSHHRRFGKTEGGTTSLSSGCA